MSLIKYTATSRLLLQEEDINSIDVLDVIYCKYRKKRQSVGEIQVATPFLGDLGVTRTNRSGKKQKTLVLYSD